MASQPLQTHEQITTTRTTTVKIEVDRETVGALRVEAARRDVSLRA